MRGRTPTFVILLAACGAPAAPPPVRPAAPLPVEDLARTCSDAGVGIERATRGIRAPDSSVGPEMRGRCLEDHWSAGAIDCFARMREGELGTCARKLPEGARDAMFAALGGTDDTAVAIAKIRLADMRVGVPECDELFATAHAFVTCEAVPLEDRAQAGAQIADSWNLPAKLPPDARARIAKVCRESREALAQRSAAAGCP